MLYKPLIEFRNHPKAIPLVTTVVIAERTRMIDKTSSRPSVSNLMDVYDLDVCLATAEAL
jgi:hypothetical protein